MAKNIWIIQTAFLGDCVLSLPFLQRSCELHPDAHFQVITSAAGFEIIQLALERGLFPYRKQIHLHLLEKRTRHKSFLSLKAFVKEIKILSGGSPEIVYCLQRSARSGLIALLSGAPFRVGFSSGSASLFYNKMVPRQWNSGQSEVEKNLDLLRAIEGSERVKTWDSLEAPSLLRNQSLAASTEKTLAIALGSPWPTKRWPEEHAADLAIKISDLGLKVHLLGDDKSKDLAQKVKSLCPSLLLQDFVGQTNMKAWVDLIQQASVLVCNDSAATHVAADLGVPAVVIFGPTLPDFGFAPWRKGSIAVGVGQLHCRPCHIHGPKKCPEEHHLCMKNISGEQVFRSVFKLLQMR